MPGSAFVASCCRDDGSRSGSAGGRASAHARPLAAPVGRRSGRSREVSPIREPVPGCLTNCGTLAGAIVRETCANCRRIPRTASLTNYCTPTLTRDPDILRDAGKVFRDVAPRYTRDALPKLAAFRRPVLLAWSTDDVFFPYAHAEQLQEVFPDAQLAPIRDARTLVAEDQPEALAAALEDFLRATA